VVGPLVGSPSAVECYIDARLVVMRVVRKYVVMTWIVNMDVLLVCWIACECMTTGYSNAAMNPRRRCWRAVSTFLLRCEMFRAIT
jgi:hypothetical protein